MLHHLHLLELAHVYSVSYKSWPTLNLSQTSTQHNPYHNYKEIVCSSILHLQIYFTLANLFYTCKLYIMLCIYYKYDSITLK